MERNTIEFKKGYFAMTEKEIEIVMNALSGTPTVTSAAFADKVEKILREYKENETDKLSPKNAL
jgi:hypothetical protein